MRVGDLRRHLFLNLQPLGINVYHPGQLRDANDAAVWNISHPGPADDRRHVVLAMAFEANIPQYDHFVVAFDLLKSLFQNLNRVLPVSREKLFERPSHASWRFDQAVTVGIFTRPSDHCTHRGFDVG